MNIQLQNVTYTYAGKYQRVTAVDGVSYTFHDGTERFKKRSGQGRDARLNYIIKHTNIPIYKSGGS